MNEQLEKRVKAHAGTISIWLASTVTQREDESLRDFRERLIRLGAEHAMTEVNAPLLRAILEASKEVVGYNLDGGVPNHTDHSVRGFEPK